MTQRTFDVMTRNNYLKGCFPRVSYAKDANMIRIKVCENTQVRSTRLFVYDEGCNEWTHGFYSYDGRGIIFYSPRTHRYEFSGPIVNVWSRERVNKCGGMVSSEPVFNGLRWGRNLKKGIENENKICDNLNTANVDNLKIHHLENSGHLSGGSDIVVSLNPIEPEESSYDTVLRGVCAIEVLGIKKRGLTESTLSFMLHRFINFQRWRSDLIKNDVLPVIAWNYEGKSWFVIMTDSALYDGFYIGEGELKHQQTNYPLVRKILEYKLNVTQLFYCIRCHLKTVSIIHTIEKNKPVSYGQGSEYFYSKGYPLKPVYDYDVVIDKIRSYLFETCGADESSYCKD
ncbi:MAG: hypothetical protein NT038_07860 [Euryarchaeota archaeon]|nr:hypothetical protein [Euryarchaeota archaeon]